MKVIAALLALLVVPATASAAESVQAPTALTVEHQAHPLAVESAAPLLGWQVNDRRFDAKQTAYEIKVGTTPNASDAWDSGKVGSSDSANVAYAGPALNPSTRYFWSVRTWDTRDTASPYSQPSAFGTKAAWQATPIWSSAPVLGSDYDVDADFTVATVAAGLKFRVNGSNSFMWQIRGDSSNELRPHVQVNGTYTQLKAVRLPMTIGLNTKHHVRINAVGSTITTYIDGVLVDTTIDTRNPSGSIGFRHGSTESSTWDNVKVTSGSTVLYQNDFEAPSTDFACGTVSGGVLNVPRSADCAYGVTDNWAFLRKRFAVADKPIAWATAYVSARSTEPAHQYVYKASLNGTVLGVGPTRAINNTTTTMYNAYDVTGLLRRGADNAFGALAYTTTDKRFVAQLVIAYADGTRDVVNTDDTWKALAGEVAMPQAGSVGTSYYAAPVENLDARVYPSGFDTPSFDDSAWSAATTKAAMPGLTGTEAAPVTQRLRTPVKIVKTADKRYFLDFGRTVVGGLQLTLEGSGGEPVEIRLGEEQANNVVDYTLRTGNTYRDVWTLRPGTQTLSLWGYRVFRYAEVLGADLTEANVKATSLVYPYDPNASSFSSSNSDLDTVYAFNRDGVRELNLDLHMDSPTRERAPYEGDNLIHMLIQGYDDGDWTNSKYTLEWLAVNETWPAEWRFSSILSAYEYWQATGDITPARNRYADLKAFLPTSFLRASDGLVEKNPGSSSQANADLVDWPDAERDGYVFTTVNTVINSWAYRAYADMAAMAAALGNDADAASWNTIAARMRSSINEKLYDPATGNYKDGLTTTHKSVHASVFPIAMGVAGPDQLGPAAQYVANRGIVCSVFCANFLINALYDAGRGDDAVRLLTNTGTRSWLHMIALGAGSPMEAWDPSLKSNTTFSHPWAGSPAYLVYRGTLGVRPLEPGYKRFAIKPQPGTLTHAEATMPSVRGTIGAAFATTDHGMDVAVKVPANSTAVVTLPDDTREVGAGCHILSHGTPAASVRDFAEQQGCDLEAPVLHLSDVTAPIGSPASYPATATDAFDGDVPVTCDGPSSVPVGPTIVTCTATDAAGNTATGTFILNGVAQQPGGVGGTVPAALSLVLGAAPSFGFFAPGVARDYTAQTGAMITSTAGDAALSVSVPGHLTNGAFALPQPLRVEFSKAAWDGPVSNDPVTITFRQRIEATDPLRTGLYARTLTFTLSTTAP